MPLLPGHHEDLTRALHTLPQPRLAVRVLSVAGPPLQRPLPARQVTGSGDEDAAGVPLTFGQALAELLPSLFTAEAGSDARAGGAGGRVAGTDDAEADTEAGVDGGAAVEVAGAADSRCVVPTEPGTVALDYIIGQTL